VTRVLVLDGYVDKPGSLGVPPFLGFYPRYMAGAALAAGAGVDYATVDDWRAGLSISDFEFVALVAGAMVPGKYIVTMPASDKELGMMISSLKDHGTPMVSAGPIAHHIPGDPAARLHDIIRNGETEPREVAMEEWSLWAEMGARIASQPNSLRPTIAEVETYKGCVRYASGGCLFCLEPGKGEPRYRMPRDIEREVAALAQSGIKHFRLGGQTCIFSYMALGVGDTETPAPNPDMLEEMFRGVRKAAPDLQVLHVDNANPAVIASHPEEARRAADILVEHCTAGNVVALGLESADPKVARDNNLNSTPEQTMAAVKLLNEVGGEIGDSGLPELLPGINFLGGLRGETMETYSLNIAFLDSILSSDMLLRRINIRQVRWPVETPFLRTEFVRFKRAVRERIDNVMLRRLVPEGTVLRNVYTEMAQGHVVYGRQLGSYPLLIGIPYETELGEWVDVAVADHGSRSVTGVIFPMDVNTASLRALEALPGIGRKRALRIFHARPLCCPDDLMRVLGDAGAAARVLLFIHF